MTDQTLRVNITPAKLDNVGRLISLVQTLKVQPSLTERIGCYFGHPGSGKTLATGFCRNAFGALIVEVGETWTRKNLLENILVELDMDTKGTTYELSARIIRALSLEPDRPLIIDEADKLVDKNMIEVVREIYNATRNPIILVGEERLPEKLAQTPRMHDRVLYWVPLEPCSTSDMKLLAEAFCPAIEIEEDLVAEILRVSAGRARLIGNNLSMVKRFYGTIEPRPITLADVQRGLLSGATPAARSFPKAEKR